MSASEKDAASSVVSHTLAHTMPSPAPLFTTAKRSPSQPTAERAARPLTGEACRSGHGGRARLLPRSIALAGASACDSFPRLFDQQGIRYKEDQPYRTAWATIRDWVSAQMALLDWDMVKLEEIFLPYMVHYDGHTYFEKLEEHGFVLPEGKE